MKFKRKYRVDGESKRIEKARKKNPIGYEAFLSQGGGKSGVYDVSDSRTKAFVRNYGEFIPKREIYRRDRNGSLIAVSWKQRRKDKAWKKAYAKRQKRGKK